MTAVEITVRLEMREDRPLPQAKTEHLQRIVERAVDNAIFERTEVKNWSTKLTKVEP